MHSVDFIIPTLKRPDHLRRCLEALSNQTTPPTHVFVGIRWDDSVSESVVNEFAAKMQVRRVDALGVGVVGSMNSCLEKCQSDLIGFVDDDVELPANWIESMHQHLEANPKVVAAGGRDLLMDHPEMRKTEKLVNDVGQFRWYGRVSGDHHRGGGAPRLVDILRGSNCLYRGNFLREVGFEKRLKGNGAQVNWELALALQAKHRKLKLFYDPKVQVLHHVAPRFDSDTVHRGMFNAQGTFDISHNESVVVLTHATGFQRFAMLGWQLAVGTPSCPGLMRVVHSFAKADANISAKVKCTFAGRLAAIKTWRNNIEHASQERVS